MNEFIVIIKIGHTAYGNAVGTEELARLLQALMDRHPEYGLKVKEVRLNYQEE